MNKLAIALLALLIAIPLSANAWWDAKWSKRAKISLNTSATGVDTREALVQVPLLVLLHAGNFSFIDAREDGADLRFVAGDDKTPLKHHVERWDSINQIAAVWVQLPKLTPASDKEFVWLYSGNPEALAGEDAKGSYDAHQVAAYQFREGDAAPKDVTANGNNATTSIVTETAGLIGAAATFKGAAMVVPASPSLKLTRAAGFTFSAWIKLTDPAQRATLYAQQSGASGLAVMLDGGKLAMRSGVATAAPQLAGGTLRNDTWQHVAVTAATGHAALYVDGQPVAQGELALPDPELQAEVRIGDGYSGLMDEVRLSNEARSAEWIRVESSSQGLDAKLAVVSAEGESASSGGSSYFGILLSNLTTDAWVVIIILMAMFVIAIVVMIGKAQLVNRTDRDNRKFLHRFRAASENFLEIGEHAGHDGSSLYRLYRAGVSEISKRFGGSSGPVTLSGASINAIKAAIDADMVRETHRLNSQMVLLTIAISGGPFLGLLGTVVGVMITFAAIAAAGDVNVNAIAPGIAAALLATVAGLSVAIPSLFGYNYLASRIKNISADMQIFVDELVTRIAESYTAG